MPEPFLDELLRVNVGERSGHASRAALVAPHDAAAEHPAIAAVLTANPVRVREVIGLAGEMLVYVPLQPRGVVGMDTR